MSIDFDEIRQLAAKQRETSLELRDELASLPHTIEGNFIAFFGRQFDPSYRWNTALKPLWSGFYIKYNELEMVVDPGINILARAQQIGVNLSRANTLYVSHAHIDHSNDANVVAEMAAYRKGARLHILMSQKTIDDGIMSHYHKSVNSMEEGENITTLDNFEEVILDGGVSLKPIKVVHSIDGSYGFVLDIGKLKVGYTADTGLYKTYKTQTGEEYLVQDVKDKREIESPGTFNQEIIDAFKGVDILAFNLHDVDFRKQSKHNLYHSTVTGAVQLLSESGVKLCVFDHFNPYGSLGPSYPEKVNSYIQEKSGKNTKMVGLEGFVVQLDDVSK